MCLEGCAQLERGKVLVARLIEFVIVEGWSVSRVGQSCLWTCMLAIADPKRDGYTSVLFSRGPPDLSQTVFSLSQTTLKFQALR